MNPHCDAALVFYSSVIFFYKKKSFTGRNGKISRVAFACRTRNCQIIIRNFRKTPATLAQTRVRLSLKVTATLRRERSCLCRTQEKQMSVSFRLKTGGVGMILQINVQESTELHAVAVPV